uniref:Uncharacterized protein n=1 Tax=Knipowitschia caucasica TaxID=637954 RepID=A0AAV2KEX6_KNICA
METMAKTVLSQVCKLVDEDTAELRLEYSRLLFANSALSEKVSSLQCELSKVKTVALSKSQRTVAVQTDCSDEGGGHRDDINQPTIEKIFGKDWCEDLWKDKDPSVLDNVADSTDQCDKTSDDVKKEDISVASSSLQTNPQAEKDEDTKTNHSSNGLEDNLLHLEESKDTDDVSTYTIPIEDDEEDDDVQFVDESQQGPSLSVPTSSDDVEDLDNYSLDTLEEFDMGTLTHHMKSHKSNFCNICKQMFPSGQLDTHVCVPPVASHKVTKSCELCVFESSIHRLPRV